MYNYWMKDMTDSMVALEKIRNTYLSKMLSGKIYNIENSDNRILILMDLKSGIDYIRENEKGLQGIAARVQWGKAWNTFTIRSERYTGSKTELEKRQKAIEEGYFYPAFTLQAYFDNRENNNLLSIAVIRTVDLYYFIENNTNRVYSNKSDNRFLFVKWSDIQNNHPMRIIIL